MVIVRFVRSILTGLVAVVAIVAAIYVATQQWTIAKAGPTYLGVLALFSDRSPLYIQY